MSKDNAEDGSDSARAFAAVTARAGRISLNAFLNALTTVTNALAGFLILPFLVDRLGASTYGLWALIVAITGYLLVFDAALTGSVGRMVAGHRATNDVRAVGQTASTALVLAFVLGSVVAVVAAAIALSLPLLFEVPSTRVPDAQLSLTLMGLTLGVLLPEAVLYGILWGYERFDFQNLVEISAAVLRAILILCLITPESRLLDLAVIFAGVSAASTAARAYLCFVAEPDLSLSTRRWSPSLVPEILRSGGWFALLRLRSRVQDLAVFVIGHLLGPIAVTTFVIPKMLITYGSLLVQAVTQAMGPQAAIHHFRKEDTAQRELFLAGGVYGSSLAFFFLGGYLLFGYPFLLLWQGGQQVDEYLILVVLAFGEFLPLSQWTTYSAIVAAGRLRFLAMLAAPEACCILLLSLLLTPRFGLLGGAFAVAASGAVFRGILQCAYGCLLLDISPWRYARGAISKTLIVAVVTIGLFLMVNNWNELSNWPELLITITLYAVVYWIWQLAIILGPRQLVSLARSLVGESTRRRRRGERSSLEPGKGD